MSKKDQIKSSIEQYTDVRKLVYNSIQKEGLSDSTQKLNQDKKDLGQKIFNLIHDRELDGFVKDFQEIIGSRISSCSTKEMEHHIKNNHQDAYFNCLELQKSALLEAVDHHVLLRATILDLEDGILVCNGVHHNGICHPE